MASPKTTKCDRCRSSICCTYTTEALGVAPRSKADFQHLLWQISHEGVELYKDDSGWYLMFQGRCQHLQPDGRCSIYETRPMICREYTNDWCEFDQPAEEGFELYFKDYFELLDYCKRRFKRWDK